MTFTVLYNKNSYNDIKLTKIFKRFVGTCNVFVCGEEAHMFLILCRSNFLYGKIENSKYL